MVHVALTKFSDYLPLYRLMADRVRASHVVGTDDTVMPMLAKGKAANARMWVYVGDEAGPYNIFNFTLNRGRDGSRPTCHTLSRSAHGKLAFHAESNRTFHRPSCCFRQTMK